MRKSGQSAWWYCCTGGMHSAQAISACGGFIHRDHSSSPPPISVYPLLLPFLFCFGPRETTDTRTIYTTIRKKKKKKRYLVLRSIYNDPKKE